VARRGRNGGLLTLRRFACEQRVRVAGKAAHRPQRPFVAAAHAPVDIPPPDGVNGAMPRRRAPPRLYLDPGRRVWVIRDAGAFVRLGLPEAERAAAERRLAEYLGRKWEPPRTNDPLIAEVLALYARDHAPHVAQPRNIGYSITYLSRWWGTKHVSTITVAACRQYVSDATSVSTARKDLEILRAACRFYSRTMGVPLSPAIVLPPKEVPRDRWLTRSEAARLLKAARPFPHLARFILLGLHTGSRPKNIFGLTWAQIDMEAGVMRRRAYREREQSRKRAPPVRLGRRILSHLRRWRKLEPQATHVVHWNGKPIAQFSNTWPIMLKRAGLEDDVTPHTLRHSRATWLLQKGVDVWQVAGHLGMTVATLTKTYGHHDPAWQRDAAEA